MRRMRRREERNGAKCVWERERERERGEIGEKENCYATLPNSCF